MIDHIGVSVSNLETSKAFYLKALAPLGYTLIMEWEGWAGFGIGDKPDFWIHAVGKTTPKIHIAFAANDRKSVDHFYEAAIATGGHDNGKPGLRPVYHPNYYGAYVIDPDGYNIEAVCHKPE